MHIYQYEMTILLVYATCLNSSDTNIKWSILINPICIFWSCVHTTDSVHSHNFVSAPQVLQISMKWDMAHKRIAVCDKNFTKKLVKE